MYERIIKTLKDVFMTSVRAVQVPSLFKHNVEYDAISDTLKIFGTDHSLINKKLYMVGAGKAVFQMALEMEKLLGSRLTCGILSVPVGMAKRSSLLENSVLTFHEGAENNLPDARAELATCKIMELIKPLDENAVLLVLLSGGGSALLPAPLPPVTLEEKCDLIKRLSNAGASIIELNTVRKRISAIKGGKLSELAHPANVITLMLSDIIGNHADFIASGPTFPNIDDPAEAMNIIKRYNLEHTLPLSILHILQDVHMRNVQRDQLQVDHYTIGSNITAINSAHVQATQNGFQSIILSDSVHGDVDELSKEYFTIVAALISVIKGISNKKFAERKLQLLKRISLHSGVIEKIVNFKYDAQKEGVLLIAGGEPTVNVTGDGKGGRNQELPLRFSYVTSEDDAFDDLFREFNIFMLSAGTDGIDGPTDAAGAIGYNGLIDDAADAGLRPETFIRNNNTYQFYRQFMNGDFHINTGHTGTNVMDIHFILISLRK